MRGSDREQIIEVLEVRDTVYVVSGSEIIKATVEDIECSKLKTDKGDLYFRDYRQLWWLTRFFAQSAAKERSAK